MRQISGIAKKANTYIVHVGIDFLLPELEALDSHLFGDRPSEGLSSAWSWTFSGDVTTSKGRLVARGADLFLGQVFSQIVQKVDLGSNIHVDLFRCSLWVAFLLQVEEVAEESVTDNAEQGKNTDRGNPANWKTIFFRFFSSCEYAA